MPGLGESFLLPTPGNPVAHLWVIVTKPDPATGLALAVSVTTQRANSDTTTVLAVGDHPFITHPSVVFYSDAREVVASLVDAVILAGTWPAHQPFSLQVLAQIQAGVLTSRFTPKKAKDCFLKAQSEGRT